MYVYIYIYIYIYMWAMLYGWHIDVNVIMYVYLLSSLFLCKHMVLVYFIWMLSDLRKRFWNCADILSSHVIHAAVIRAQALAVGCLGAGMSAPAPNGGALYTVHRSHHSPYEFLSRPSIIIPRYHVLNVFFVPLNISCAHVSLSMHWFNIASSCRVCPCCTSETFYIACCSRLADFGA